MWAILEEDLALLGLSFSEAWTVASNAKEWRKRLREL
jgi:hypothetical protein